MPTRELAELRMKYEEMLRLRLLHAQAEEPDPRPAMAALAARYPGALREIDDLTMDEIRARIDALRAAEDDESRVRMWMRATIRFHALTRGALVAKRWLAGRKTAERAAFARDLVAHAHAGDAMEWVDDLAKIGTPPRGRITDLVYARISLELAVSDEEARTLVFGVPRRKKVRSSTPAG